MFNYNSIDSKRFEDGDEMETSDDYISDNDMYKWTLKGHF